MAPRSIVVSRKFISVVGLAVCGTVAVAPSGEAFAKPRVERVIERRVTKLEAMERRMEAAAQMPPRPADVRRAIRRGEPLPPTGPNGTPAASSATAAARGTPAATARAAAPRPAPSRPSPATVARPAPQRAQPKPAPAPGLRFPEQPEATQESPQPIATAPQTPSSVTPATAIDDGTRSVLVPGEPTPAAPLELLPTPPSK